MSSVAAAIRQHATAYLQQFGDRVPLGHRRVIDAITRCRTGELGHTVYHCDHCDREHWVGRSCGNRHCATCQADKTADWLAKQAQRLLPVQHFLVTFTVPEELRPTLRDHQQAGYDALFAAGSQTIRKLLAGRWLGTSKVGFFGVLHTWGRDPLVYHPHVHFVVPGGGVSEDGAKWLATPTNFLFPEACAAVIYRAK
ncbi:MAG: transposase zinc-binding domain-containing protein [Planctomycetales bacterium]|nr:transposase zinc-binding domain-containing protein [Planctomycetales bacterium]